MDVKILEATTTANVPQAADRPVIEKDAVAC